MPDPAEVSIRALLHELSRKHRLNKAIARILNERGYRTRSGSPSPTRRSRGSSSTQLQRVFIARITPAPTITGRTRASNPKASRSTRSRKRSGGALGKVDEHRERWEGEREACRPAYSTSLHRLRRPHRVVKPARRPRMWSWGYCPASHMTVHPLGWTAHGRSRPC